MYKNLLNKLGNLIESTKTNDNLPIIIDFLRWFHLKIDIQFHRRMDQNLIPKKWDIYLVELGQNIGSELNKARPCVVISDSKFNGGNNLLILPIKTYKGKINDNIHILLEMDEMNNLEEVSYISVISIRDISKKRFSRKIGRLDVPILERIDKKLLRILWIKNKPVQ